MVVGVLAAKGRLVDAHVRSSITDLVLSIFLPCNILVSFLGTSRSQIGDLGIMLIISLGTIMLCLLLSRLVYAKAKEEQKKVLLYATMISNAGFLGNPLVESIFGIGALSYTAAYLIPIRISLWTLGLAIFTGSGKGNIKKIVLHPCMIATYIGLALMMTGYRPPAIITRLAFTLGSCTTPLSMIVVGCVLGLVESKKLFSPLAFYYSFIRLVLIPLIVMGILLVLRIDTLITGISVVLSGTPGPVTTAILADRYNADRELASRIVFVSTMLSILTIPGLVFILG